MSQRERSRLRHNPDSGRQAFNSEPNANRPPQAIDLRIEQLSIDGVEAANRHAFGISVQTELTRLFAERREPLDLTKSVVFDSLSFGSFSMPCGTRTSNIGRQVAEVISRGIEQLNSGNCNSIGLSESRKHGGKF